MTEAVRDAGRHPAVPPLRPRRLSVQGMRPAPADEQYAALRRAQRISRVGSWEYDVAHEVVTVSDELLELCGVERSALAFGPRGLLNSVAPEDRAAVEAAMDQLTRGGAPVSIRYRGVRIDDGAPAWFNARGEADRDATGAVVRVACTVADISELVQVEDELRTAHRELLQAHSYQQAVIATTPDAIHLYDVARGTLTRANRAGGPLYGYSDTAAAVLCGQRLDEFVPLEDWAELTAALTGAGRLADGEVLQLRHRVCEPDGSLTWLSRRLSVFSRDALGRPAELLVVSRDVTDVVEVEQRLAHAATHDDLTGLPNRRLVQERLDGFLTGEGARAAAVLLVDLDGFKRINDAHGHSMGDAVLVSVADRLRAAARGDDTVARLGGDEFVLVLWGEDADAAAGLAEAVAQRVERALAQPFTFDGVECTLTASIGISVIGQQTARGAALAEAAAAVSSVKRHGANGHAVYDAALAEQARAQELIESSLRRALRHDLVEVHYQPIVAPGTGLVHSVEALVRIRDTDGSFLDAGAVIAVAERCGLVSELDERVLRQACAQVAAWRQDPTYADLHLTLNRSAQDILRPGFHDRIMAGLVDTGLPCHALTIEITETVLLDAEDAAIADIRLLYGRGVRLAIDDFGTGYASLSQLTRLPISTIKIDRSFTSNMLHDRTCAALVRATVGIASDLGRDCVVEGIESEEHLANLPRYRQMLIQGYLYGRPRPAADGLGITLARW
jgi:diguanylate cyclase (GGDEF)-like protein/PAS domain S-box-containing protein